MLIKKGKTIKQSNSRFILITLISLFTLLLSACGTSNLAEENEKLDDQSTEIILAELQFNNGAQAIFSYDETEQSYTLSQSGEIGQSKPFAMAESASILELFLEMTPEEVAIPQLLLAEPELSRYAMPDLAHRLSTPKKISLSNIATDISLETLGASCNKYFIPHHLASYRNIPQTNLVNASFYSSSYGGKFRYVDSYLINCTPQGNSSSNWVRHRIYYKDAFGNYKKHHEKKLSPWTWQIVRKGSVKRYRRVIYDSNICGSCKYGREGRFLN